MDSLQKRIELRQRLSLSRVKEWGKRGKKDVGIISKKLTLGRKRLDKTREMKNIKNEENRSLRNTKRNREKRRKRVVNRNS